MTNAPATAAATSTAGSAAEDAGPPRRGRGRPRSRHVEEAIITATLELLQRHGLDGLSVEAVARRAGVAKTTIYRRWPGKEQLAIDALAHARGPVTQIPDGLGLREELVFRLTRLWNDQQDPARGVLRRLFAEVDAHPDLVRTYIEQVIGPRRAGFLETLRRGVSEGVIRADADLGIAAEALVLPVLMGSWIPFGPRIGPEQIPRLVDLLLSGLGPAT